MAPSSALCAADVTTTAEKIAVMQAAIDGKAIEYRPPDYKDWHTLTHPSWNWERCEYRVKPEPKVTYFRTYFYRLRGDVYDRIETVYCFFAEDKLSKRLSVEGYSQFGGWLGDWRERITEA